MTLLNETQLHAYRHAIEAMDDDTFAHEVEQQSFLAARTTSWSVYDQRCEILAAHNTPLYDATRMRLQRSLRPH